MRILAGLLLLLLLVITATSAYIRLAQTGLSCPGAPDCYAQRETRAAADDDSGLLAARALHRVAASAAGIAIVAMLFVGWSNARPGERTALLALAVLAGMLAWLGRYTPSGLPAVALGNLLGGMAMLALGAWLVLALRRSRPILEAGAVRPWAWIALALVMLQIAAGGFIAARHAAFACSSFPGCHGAFWPAGVKLAAFDPWRELVAPTNALERADVARQAVVLAHRWLAIPTLLIIGWLGVGALHRGASGPGLALIALAIAQLALGTAQVFMGQPLGLAVAHNIAGAMIVVALAGLLERSRRS